MCWHEISVNSYDAFRTLDGMSHIAARLFARTDPYTQRPQVDSHNRVHGHEPVPCGGVYFANRNAATLWRARCVSIGWQRRPLLSPAVSHRPMNNRKMAIRR